jgi:hypothetical protein
LHGSAFWLADRDRGITDQPVAATVNRAKRLTLYALLIEVLTLALMAVLFLFAARTHPG